MPQSPVGQNSDGGISDFWIYSQPFIKENYHKLRTNDGIDMKLELGIKIDKKNNTTSKTFAENVKLANYDIFVILSIYDHFGAIGKQNSKRIVCKTYIFINSNFLSYKS